MYIFGGRTEEGTDLGDLAAFRITSRRWYTFQNMGPSPSPRSGHSMTSYGKQIIVLAGEPSSTPRDSGELSLVYVLDTGKIRYPNDQQIQQTPSGERVPGNRRPSQERGGPGMGPGPRAINGPNGGPENLNRKYSDSRESIVGVPRGPGQGPGPGMGPGTAGRGQDPMMVNGGSQPGQNSRLPRASTGQPPPGPPQQQQPHPPRSNGAPPSGSRSRTPTREGQGRAYGPPLDTNRGLSFERENASPPVTSPIGRDGPRQGPTARAMSPAVNGLHTPTQQAMQQPMQTAMQPPSRLPGQGIEDEDPIRYDPNASRSRSRQGASSAALTDESSQVPNAVQQRFISNPYEGPDLSYRNHTPQRSDPSVPLQQLQQLQSQHDGLRGEHDGLQNQHEGLRTEHEGLRGQHRDVLDELDAAKSRNAWYASELVLAKKAGYQQNISQSPTLDQKAAQSLDDEDKPLLEALITMRAQLSEVQSSIADRENVAAQEVAEMEQQRDSAVREAVYAKAKLAAHGGSHAGTPQSESMSRDLSNDDRSTDIGRKLALALATQNELRMIIATMINDIQNERQARELAEGSADAAHKRATEFDQSRNPGELETLRTELHQTGKIARDEAAAKSEAHSRAQLLAVEKEDLSRKLAEALENSKQHNTTFAALREAVISSTDKANLLEKKLDEERRQRELIDRKLVQLRAEHEERTAELDETTRKLRDAEEMVTTNAAEAKTHRQAVVAGLDKLSSRSVSNVSNNTEDERVPVLKQQVESAHALVRKNQADADNAAEKLRRAEERIAGLEAYQEQSSREGLTVRRQLQDAVKGSQALQGKHSALQQQLESNQRDARALSVKHSALKDLLEERGISQPGTSRNMDSPASRFDTPDNPRVRELEQQLEASVQAHQETKSSIETRELEADRTYREKLELLENDYTSAVHYVKGTEKMLKRMKDELTKYKMQNERLQSDLDTAQRSGSDRSLEPQAAAEWEQERQLLRKEIGEMQRSVKDSVSELEHQMTQIRSELLTAQKDRDHYRQSTEATQQQLTTATQQARNELDQLKSENNMLETRAVEAEQRVTLLLDQVGTSVGNYRRQSQNMHANGHSRNQSNVSTTSTNPPLFSRGLHSHTTSMDPSSFPPVPEALSTSNPTTRTLDTTTTSTGAAGEATENNRNSVALDSLASELETLRSHWADTHRSYRLSNQFDFERSAPNSATGAGSMSDSLANWRKRLDAEEAEKATYSHPSTNPGSQGMIMGGIPGPGGIHMGGGNSFAKHTHTGEESSEEELERPDRESGVIRPNEKMPGGLGGLSDEEDESDEEIGRRVQGRGMGGG